MFRLGLKNTNHTLTEIYRPIYDKDKIIMLTESNQELQLSIWNELPAVDLPARFFIVISVIKSRRNSINRECSYVIECYFTQFILVFFIAAIEQFFVCIKWYRFWVLQIVTQHYSLILECKITLKINFSQHRFNLSTSIYVKKERTK